MMLWMMVMRLISGHAGKDVDGIDGDVADADVTIILITIIHSIINILPNSPRIIHIYMHDINIDLNIMCNSSSNLTNVTNNHSTDG